MTSLVIAEVELLTAAHKAGGQVAVPAERIQVASDLAALGLGYYQDGFFYISNAGVVSVLMDTRGSG